MNVKKFLLLIIIGYFLSSCAAIDRLTERRLEGTWYLNGDLAKRCEIVSNGNGLEARNERGQTTALVREGVGSVRAVQWDNLRGEVRDDRILWANGATWTRASSR